MPPDKKNASPVTHTEMQWGTSSEEFYFASLLGVAAYLIMKKMEKPCRITCQIWNEQSQRDNSHSQHAQQN